MYIYTFFTTIQLRLYSTLLYYIRRGRGRKEGTRKEAKSRQKGKRNKEKAGREASEYTSIVRVCEAMWGKYNRVEYIE